MMMTDHQRLERAGVPPLYSYHETEVHAALTLGAGPPPDVMTEPIWLLHVYGRSATQFLSLGTEDGRGINHGVGQAQGGVSPPALRYTQAGTRPADPRLGG